MTYPIEQQDENVTRLLRIYSQELPDSKARLVHEDSRREVYMIRFECGGKPLIENFTVEEIEDSVVGQLHQIDPLPKIPTVSNLYVCVSEDSAVACRPKFTPK